VPRPPKAIPGAPPPALGHINLAPPEEEVHSPGSPAFEGYKEQLLAIYRNAEEPDPEGKADYVLGHYLAKPGGLKRLNGKLEEKYSRQLVVFAPH